MKNIVENEFIFSVIKNLTDEEMHNLFINLGKDVLYHFGVLDFSNYPQSDFIRVLESLVNVANK